MKVSKTIRKVAEAPTQTGLDVTRSLMNTGINIGAVKSSANAVNKALRRTARQRP
jgi:hypothetical protein